MNKVILYIAMSLDGFIADSDGGVSWLDSFNNADYGYNEFMERVSVLIMGSNTYQQILTFGDWPYATKQSFVMSQNPIKSENSEIIGVSTNVNSVTRNVKSIADSKDVWLVGGAKVTQSFLAANAIDEMMLFIMPTLLGSGIPLFTQHDAQTTLNLHKSTAYKNGVVLLHYKN